MQPELEDGENPYHVGAPGNGDLWATYVHHGGMVRKGDEPFDITIMKQEKAALSPVGGSLRRVLKFADYRSDREMASVHGGGWQAELAGIEVLEDGPRPCGRVDRWARPSPPDMPRVRLSGGGVVFSIPPAVRPAPVRGMTSLS